RCGCASVVRGTIPKLIADRARTLPVWPALSDQDSANSRLSREKSGCHFQPKHPRQSERARAQSKIENKLQFQNLHPLREIVLAVVSQFDAANTNGISAGASVTSSLARVGCLAPTALSHA